MQVTSTYSQPNAFGDVSTGVSVSRLAPVAPIQLGRRSAVDAADSLDTPLTLTLTQHVARVMLTLLVLASASALFALKLHSMFR